jgi:hypothetical protein
MNVPSTLETPQDRYNVSACTASGIPVDKLTSADTACTPLKWVAADGQEAQRADDRAAAPGRQVQMPSTSTSSPSDAADPSDVEHGSACECRQCQAGRRRLARMEQDLEFSFHQDFPEAKFYTRRDCIRDHHLWSDLDLQLNHFKCLPEDKQQLLKHAYSRVSYDLPDGSPGFWKRQKEWEDYDATASIIALSSYEGQEDFLRCGYYGYSCQKRPCLRCVYNLVAEPALIEFRDSFGADNECYFVVTSLSREPDERKRLIFKDLTKSEMQQVKRRGQFEQGSLDDYGIPFVDPDDVLQTRIYWQIFGNAIHEVTDRRMRRGKLFSGAFGGPELSVRFRPLAALPHANYVAWSPGFCAEDARRLRRVVRDKLRGSRRIKPGLYPHLGVYRILSADDLQRVIEYIFKPIALAYAYMLTASKLDRDPEQLALLNRQVNVFLENLDGAFYGMDRMNRYGFCNASSGDDNYIGVVTAKRRARRLADAVRRAGKKREQAALKENFPGYKLLKRKKTQQEKDARFLMQAGYRKLVRDGEL